MCLNRSISSEEMMTYESLEICDLRIGHPRSIYQTHYVNFENGIQSILPYHEIMKI